MYRYGKNGTGIITETFVAERSNVPVFLKHKLLTVKDIDILEYYHSLKRKREAEAERLKGDNSSNEG